MVAEHALLLYTMSSSCSLAKISMVAEQNAQGKYVTGRCSLAKISMVAEPQNI